MMTHFTLEISFPTYTIECLRKIILQNALCGAHGSVVISFRSVTQMLLVQTPLWSLDVMFCALRQGTLSTLSQSTHLKLGTSICWGFTFDRLVSHPGPGESMTLIRFAPRKSGISTGLMCLHGSEKDLTLKSSLYLLVK